MRLPAICRDSVGSLATAAGAKSLHQHKTLDGGDKAVLITTPDKPCSGLFDLAHALS